MNKEDIRKINLESTAIPGKPYSDDIGNKYIGTKEKRLKLLDKAEHTIFKPNEEFSPYTKDVQTALEEVSKKITLIENDYVTETELSIAIDEAKCFSVAISIIL